MYYNLEHNKPFKHNIAQQTYFVKRCNCCVICVLLFKNKDLHLIFKCIKRIVEPIWMLHSFLWILYWHFSVFKVCNPFFSPCHLFLFHFSWPLSLFRFNELILWYKKEKKFATARIGTADLWNASPICRPLDHDAPPILMLTKSNNKMLIQDVMYT